MTLSYTPPKNGFRTFVIAWITQSISVFGSELTFFALTIWLTTDLYPDLSQKGQLALALSAVGLAFSLPNVFAAPLAGAWADRHDRKRTMMVADFSNGVLSLLLMFLVFSDRLTLPILLGLMVVSAFVSAFHFSAFDTSYAMLVTPEQLPRANGMMQTIWALSTIISPGIAATIISLPNLARQGQWSSGLGGWLAGLQSGVALNMGLDAATFFIAATTLAFLVIPSPQRTDLMTATGEKKSIWVDIKDGGMFIWRRRPLLWLLATFTVANFAGGAFVLLPMLVKYNLAADWAARGFTLETAMALLATIGSLGGVAGGVLVSAWGGLRSKRVYGVVLSILISALLMIAMGYSAGLYLTAGIMFAINILTPS